MTAAPSFAIPESAFGMTLHKHNVPALSHDLPERALLVAGNEFNRIRFHELSVRQRLFVDKYLESGLDTTAAAIAAGYPEEEAASVGKAQMRKPAIIKAVQAALAYHAERTQLRLEPITEELKKIAFASIRSMWKKDENGDPRLVMPEPDDPILDCISEITVDTYMEGRGDSAREIKRVRYKMYDKMIAMEKLLKIMNVQGIVGPAQQVTSQTVNGDVNNVTNNVSKINLVMVPSGAFIPAPERPNKPPEYTPVTDQVIDVTPEYVPPPTGDRTLRIVSDNT